MFHKLHKTDKGFTLLEVVFSIVILTIALLALLPLLYLGTTNSIKAKVRTEATTAASNYIEQVRQMDYTTIGIPSGSPAGDLTPIHISKPSMEITITPIVTWVDDPEIAGTENYKKLDVTVDIYSDSITHNYQFVTSTYVRRDSFTGTLISPTIEFGFLSPSINDIVYGSSVTVDAVAETGIPNGFISNLRFYCDGVFLRDSFNVGAEWSPGTATVSESFNWDTTNINEDSLPTAPDGVRTLKIEAWDSVGQQVYVTRQVIVDNFAPNAPTGLGAYPYTDTQMRYYWNRAYDGTDIASKYYVSVWRQNASSNWILTEINVPVTTNGWTRTAPASFGRYYFSVQAASPRDLKSNTITSTGTYITKPLASGTTQITAIDNKVGNQATIVSSINVIKPGFAYSSLSYNLYRANTPDMAGQVLVGTMNSGSPYFTLTDTTSSPPIVDKKIGAPPVYYRVQAIVTPIAGFDGGVSKTIWSNVLQSASGTKTTSVITMPTARW